VNNFKYKNKELEK